MPNNAWEAEFIERWRAMFEYEARGFEACLNDSYHSKFAHALSELEALIESADEKVELEAFIAKLLEQLLQIAALAPKLPREWLNSGDFEEELDTDSFYLAEETTKALTNKLRSIFGTRLDEIIGARQPFAEYAPFFVDDFEEFYSEVMPGLHAWNLKTDAGMSEAHFFWHLDPWHWSGHLMRSIQTLNTMYYHERDTA
jgi:hypothetical protein